VAHPSGGCGGSAEVLGEPQLWLEIARWFGRLRRGSARSDWKQRGGQRHAAMRKPPGDSCRPGRAGSRCEANGPNAGSKGGHAPAPSRPARRFSSSPGMDVGARRKPVRGLGHVDSAQQRRLRPRRGRPDGVDDG